jgi:hypothetical protein
VYVRKETVLASPFISKHMPNTDIVLKLSELINHTGYILWMDNNHTSPHLAKFLKSCNNVCLRTVKINRKIELKKVKDKKLQNGDIIAQHNGPGVHSQLE